MELNWEYSLENIDFVELSTQYKIAPLGEKSSDDLKVAFENSMFKCFIFHKEALVAVGRCIADGVYCSYICDVAVHPSYQNLGLGKDIILKLLDLSKEHKKILLYSNIGKEGFYKKFGFKKMNTAMAIFDNEKQAIQKGMLSDN